MEIDAASAVVVRPPDRLEPDAFAPDKLAGHEPKNLFGEWMVFGWCEDRFCHEAVADAIDPHRPRDRWRAMVVAPQHDRIREVRPQIDSVRIDRVVLAIDGVGRDRELD